MRFIVNSKSVNTFKNALGNILSKASCMLNISQFSAIMYFKCNKIQVSFFEQEMENQNADLSSSKPHLLFSIPLPSEMDIIIHKGT